jgi:hypothetical protein
MMIGTRLGGQVCCIQLASEGLTIDWIIQDITDSLHRRTVLSRKRVTHVERDEGHEPFTLICGIEIMEIDNSATSAQVAALYQCAHSKLTKPKPWRPRPAQAEVYAVNRSTGVGPSRKRLSFR